MAARRVAGQAVALESAQRIRHFACAVEQMAKTDRSHPRAASTTSSQSAVSPNTSTSS